QGLVRLAAEHQPVVRRRGQAVDRDNDQRVDSGGGRLRGRGRISVEGGVAGGEPRRRESESGREHALDQRRAPNRKREQARWLSSSGAELCTFLELFPAQPK